MEKVNKNSLLFWDLYKQAEQCTCLLIENGYRNIKRKKSCFAAVFSWFGLFCLCILYINFAFFRGR